MCTHIHATASRYWYVCSMLDAYCVGAMSDVAVINGILSPGTLKLSPLGNSKMHKLSFQLAWEHVARPGRRTRRVSKGTSVHHERTVREKVARPGGSTWRLWV
jgi:hypothetical protein